MAAEGEVVLEVEDLRVDLGSQRVLDGVTLRVRAGEFVGIAGPNGGGKSTLLRAVLDLVPTSSGHVRLFGKEHGNGAVHRRIAYLAQNEAHIDPLFPATALEVACLGRIAGRGLLRWLAPSDRKAAQQALDEVGVGELRDRLIGRLSGGQRQRVLLAKAIAGDPDMLILDEPTTGIDPKARDDFHHLLADLNARRGITILLVSHDKDFLAHVARRVILVDRTIHFDGDPKDQPDALAHVHGHDHGSRP